MSLIINKTENVFELSGILNETNADALGKTLTKALKKFDKLIISIHNIERMNRYGVDTITRLHYYALDSNKRITIIGDGCRELYDHFRTSTTVVAA